MSSAEFAEWMAYYQIEPFGQERDNWHAATLATLIAGSAGAKGEATKIESYMLRPRPQRRQSPQSIYQAFRAWAVAQGARPKK
jgi:hypothetical protein